MTEINESTVPIEQNPNFRKTAKARRKKIIIISLVAVFIIIGVAGIGFAKNIADKYREGGPWGFMLNRITKDLNLTEQQQAEVNKIKDEIKQRKDAIKQKRMDDANEFEQMFRGDTFDKQKALELAKRRETDREEMRNFIIDEMAKFHSILTPEQRNKVADKLKEKREKGHRFFKGKPDSH
jgi:Spy/CpxP family protein refolding chaperone